MKKQKKKLEDPIGYAVQERKDQGSYLSVLKNKKQNERELYDLSLNGNGVPLK